MCDLAVSSDPATVIFPSCVGVREREFTPLAPGGRRRVQPASRRGRQAREDPRSKVSKVRCTCARDPRVDTREAAELKAASGWKCVDVRRVSDSVSLFSSPNPVSPDLGDDSGVSRRITSHE